jgi:hypothetical protein
MNTAEQVKDVVDAAAEHLGTAIVQAGDEFILSFDGIYECSFCVVEDGAALEFATPLCIVQRDCDRLFERALSLNLHGAATRGASIALQPDGSVLVLRFRHRGETLDADGLSLILLSLIETARTIRRELLDSSADRSARTHDFLVAMRA